MDFATTIRILRVMLNWRQSQMAEALNVTTETVSRWETDTYVPHSAIRRFVVIIAERNGVIFNQKGFPEYAHGKGFEPTAKRR